MHLEADGLQLQLSQPAMRDINLVANGMTSAQIIADLPDLDEEDIQQALAYSAVLAEDQVHPLRA